MAVICVWPRIATVGIATLRPRRDVGMTPPPAIPGSPESGLSSSCGSVLRKPTPALARVANARWPGNRREIWGFRAAWAAAVSRAGWLGTFGALSDEACLQG